MAELIYFLSLAILFLFAVHRLELIRLYIKGRKVTSSSLLVPDFVWPTVTVQLPIYNEAYVVERLLRSVASLDYPRELLEIQLLDDSTDETIAIAIKEIARLKEEGIFIQHIRRSHREGYKAGALQNGLESAAGEFIAIFDADFVPPPKVLRNLLHEFHDPHVGMVQARWDYLNAQHSSLTRVQSLMLDGHFYMEHVARSNNDLLFNFNGTAGIWRARTIRTSGGWKSESLAEDLDLSYRAQLAGWRFVYRHDVLVPAELPSDWGSFKTQQYRWAKGTAQTSKRLFLPILFSTLSIRQKMEAFFHLTAVTTYLFGILLALSAPFALSIDDSPHRSFIDLGLFLFFLVSIAGFFLLPQRERGRTWRESVFALPHLMAVGIGLSLNNSVAIIDGWIGRATPFMRTPKLGSNDPHQTTTRPSYWPRFDRLRWAEIGMTTYLFGMFCYCLASGRFRAMWVLSLFSFSYTYCAIAALLERLPITTKRSEKYRSPIRLARSA